MTCRESELFMKQYFALGSYTEPILFGTGEVFQGKGKGISICSFEDGKIEVVTEVAVRNPSFLCVDETNRRIYAVNEMKEYQELYGGGITQLSYDANLQMTIDGSWNVGGTDPCHIALAPDGSFVATANFADGSVSVFSLSRGGTVIEGSRKVFTHSGSSVHPLRQKGPHAHSCIFDTDGQAMYVPDLGSDKLVAYCCCDGTVAPNPEASISVPAGNGPRYGEFSKDGAHFYLINEIGSSVTHFIREDGGLCQRETVSTLPESYTGSNICSDLHLAPDGAFVYASNRGHDSLACYRVEPDGSLALLHRQPCGGKTPRNFAIDPTGRYVLVGNQDSDWISVFCIQPDGSLTEIDRMETGSPVCIRFFRI